MANVSSGGGGKRRTKTPPGGDIWAPVPMRSFKSKMTPVRGGAKAAPKPKPKPKTPSVMRAGKTKSVAMGVARKRK